MRKSHGDNDHFFRHGPPKKLVKKEKLDLDILGKFAYGQRWKGRTGAHCIRRLNRALKKYKGDHLDLKEEPGNIIKLCGHYCFI